jgi:hypothetical protein
VDFVAIGSLFICMFPRRGFRIPARKKISQLKMQTFTSQIDDGLTGVVMHSRSSNVEAVLSAQLVKNDTIFNFSAVSPKDSPEQRGLECWNAFLECNKSIPAADMEAGLAKICKNTFPECFYEAMKHLEKSRRVAELVAIKKAAKCIEAQKMRDVIAALQQDPSNHELIKAAKTEMLQYTDYRRGLKERGIPERDEDKDVNDYIDRTIAETELLAKEKAARQARREAEILAEEKAARLARHMEKRRQKQEKAAAVEQRKAESERKAKEVAEEAALAAKEAKLQREAKAEERKAATEAARKDRDKALESAKKEAKSKAEALRKAAKLSRRDGVSRINEQLALEQQHKKRLEEHRLLVEIHRKEIDEQLALEQMHRANLERLREEQRELDEQRLRHIAEIQRLQEIEDSVTCGVCFEAYGAGMAQAMTCRCAGTSQCTMCLGCLLKMAQNTHQRCMCGRDKVVFAEWRVV